MPALTCETLDGGVALLTLRNPPLNLITLELTAQLIDAVARVRADAGIRALVITGEGARAFCAGADVSEFADVRGDVVGKKLARENEAMSAVRALPIPTIAAIGGVCLGGGAELAIACDLRVIDETAGIGFPEVHLGVFPGSGGVIRLPHIVGLPRALDLLYTGRTVPADEALAIGLATRTAAAGNALDDALALARTLAAGPALALSLIKSGAVASLTQTDEEAVAASLVDSARVFRGPDVDEGLAAFAAKRSPRFTAGRDADIQAQEEPE